MLLLSMYLTFLILLLNGLLSCLDILLLNEILVITMWKICIITMFMPEYVI